MRWISSRAVVLGRPKGELISSARFGYSYPVLVICHTGYGHTRHYQGGREWGGGCQSQQVKQPVPQGRDLNNRFSRDES
jgi:hypothetical protein